MKLIEQARNQGLNFLASILVISVIGCSGSGSGGGNNPGTGDVNTQDVQVPASGATVVKIVSINGQDSRGTALYIGESIRLKAALFDANGADLNVAKEDFVWFANDSLSDGQVDQCDVSAPEECDSTHFRVTDEGVEFILSGNSLNDVVISVESKDASAVDQNGNPLVDTVYIENLGSVPSFQPPPPLPPDQCRPFPHTPPHYHRPPLPVIEHHPSPFPPPHHGPNPPAPPVEPPHHEPPAPPQPPHHDPKPPAPPAPPVQPPHHDPWPPAPPKPPSPPAPPHEGPKPKMELPQQN